MGFLNGLSSAGAAISNYAGAVGLQYQKADLQNQSLQLADQLQGARESAGRQEAGQIAAAAADKAQTFTAGENALNRDSAQTIASGNNATTLAANAATNATSRANTLDTINADPPQIKLLRTLGVLPPAGGTPSTTATPSPATAAPASSSGTPALTSDGLVTDSSVPSAPSSMINGPVAPAANTSAGVTGSNNLQNNPIVNKVLGLPQPGTPAALEQGVARDVANDPAFANLSPGQQALETAKRIAISSGKIMAPDQQDAIAQGIANYQMAPLTGSALRAAGGTSIMAQVLKINPDYQAARFPEVSTAMAAFGSGPKGDIVRSLNVGVQHLATLDDAAQALNSTDVGFVNAVKNKLQTQFGYTAQPTFEALKQIVGTEIEKAVAGGIGAASDRDRIMTALNAANSPAQLKSVTDGFRDLMVGQLNGLRTQYQDSTHIKSGPFAFENKLDPETQAALTNRRATPASGSSSSAPDPSRPSLSDIFGNQ